MISPEQADRLRTLAWCAISYVAVLLAAKSLRFVTTDIAVFGEAFRGKYATHLPVVLAHGSAAITALVLGPPQFLASLRRWSVRLHRILGRVYAVAILVAAPTGFLMGTMAHGGLIAQVAFCTMAVLWLATMVMAVDTARRHRVAEHRAWMLRNYALTLGAATLRIYLETLVTAGFDFDTIYPWVAWAAWVPNLMVAEWWSRHTARRLHAAHEALGKEVTI